MSGTDIKRGEIFYISRGGGQFTAVSSRQTVRQ
nr:MAG TPA: hypothetical protein [Caudoviricetes sp.]